MTAPVTDAALDADERWLRQQAKNGSDRPLAIADAIGSLRIHIATLESALAASRGEQVRGHIEYAGELRISEPLASGAPDLSCALLITFSSRDDLRMAMADGRRTFAWDESASKEAAGETGVDPGVQTR